ncbi:MAG: TIR domain-containing protein [Hyphomicrobiales bacterium]|nr:TIR domain-containing protein [Hyphomicrobiales bacterium]
MDQPSPLIFLSHSGADTTAAQELKRRLLESPDARAAGLKVWFDKDDLRPGGQWQPQIEQAIASASSFVVYVGSKGVMNWVEAEVRVALSRANTNKDFLFIPALAADSAGSSALPSFAKLYQGVRDPLSDGEELAKLLKAVLKSDWDKAPQLIDEPFVGLRSMREEEVDRFFGRDAEVKELVEKFRKHRIVAIVADSGTGKSSLAEAGFVPAFRGGALADPARSEPDDRVWHVVSMRPLSNPEEGLRTGVSEAAEKLARSGDERAGLRKRIALGDPSESAFALQCDLPTKNTATLLIVDQFEELFTATPNALQAPFVRLLLGLADSDKDVRILLTVRADYFNLLSGVKDGKDEPVRGADGKTLLERLNADGGDAILSLKRMSDPGLAEAICKPLRLAGEKDEDALNALVNRVRRDISDQPSDLPLLQVALRAAWQEHNAARKSLLVAYESVGGVRGALASEAKKALKKLPEDDRARLESIFVRLVRLGDTGGATRRTAALDEFDGPKRKLVQQLGQDECGRLVSVSAGAAEIAHEALITQWDWLQNLLKNDDNDPRARDVRTLEQLMTKAREWNEAAEDAKKSRFAYGADRDLFSELAGRRPQWLSSQDWDFIEASLNWKEQEQRRNWWITWLLRGAAAAIVCALAVVGWLYFKERSATADAEAQKTIAGRQRDIAFKELKEAAKNESVALTALADIEAERRPINATKLALAAWPRDKDDLATTPQLAATLDALGRAVPDLYERRLLRGHGGPVTSATFSRDGNRIVTASDDWTARIWDAATGKPIGEPLKGHEDIVRSAAFSPDGRRIVTASEDKTARIWDAASGRELTALRGHDGEVTSAAFSPDGKRVVTASDDKTARVWDVSTIPSGNILQVACALLKMHEDPVSLDGVTDYPLTFDRPICVTDPPPPDLMPVPAAKAADAK